jgi:ABC-type dipeptide/oligopeptide/nickel transport system permease component
MLEVLNEDYIRTARSKGLAEKIVIYRHALKNAVLPVITIFGLALGNAASGSVVTEIVFSVPGMGRLLIEGVQHRDYPMIQAIIVIFGVMVLVANLMTDLTYAWLNPRIRYN